MGLGIMKGSTCGCAASATASSVAAPTAGKFGNPDPKRFQILRHSEYRAPTARFATVVEVLYPDSKNYEGRKILLYLCAYATIAEQKVLDPHFCNDGSHLSPFARFEPTARGWDAATALAQVLA